MNSIILFVFLDGIEEHHFFFCDVAEEEALVCASRGKADNHTVITDTGVSRNSHMGVLDSMRMRHVRKIFGHAHFIRPHPPILGRHAYLEVCTIKNRTYFHWT